MNRSKLKSLLALDRTNPRLAHLGDWAQAAFLACARKSAPAMVQTWSTGDPLNFGVCGRRC